MLIKLKVSLRITLFLSVIIVGFLCRCKKEHLQERVNQIKIMTFNVLYTTSFESTINVIKNTGADIIGLQENSYDRLNKIATELNYYYYHFSKTEANTSGDDTGILSKFPIIDTYSDGVLIEVDTGLKIAVFTVHLLPYPYEPYDFRDSIIKTAEEAIESSLNNRLPGILPVLSEIRLLLKDEIPVFLTGDFNEPSHLDWTMEAAAAGLHFSKVVTWPISSRIEELGLTDAYRFYYTDESAYPGITWTTIEATNEVYDRIDYIYHNLNNRVNLKKVELIGGKGYHYALLTTYQIE
jgi:exodeoxyribonuclease-3